MNSKHKNKCWPGFIPPENDELLSSWIYRVSKEHKVIPFSFALFYFHMRHFWNRDIDKFITKDVFNEILNHTPLSELHIKRMMLTSYDNILYKGELKVFYCKGITNLGIYSSNRKENGLLLCPKCLKKKPYFKKEWRLVTSLICLSCKSYLVDNCPKCNSPIIFHRLSVNNKNDFLEDQIYFCWKCKYDFRDIDKPVINNDLILNYQNYINDSISNGYNFHSQYSFLYFEVFFLIYRRIRTDSNVWNRVREGFKKEYGIDHMELYSSKQYYSSLDFRILILPLVYHLLENWPYRFIEFCKKNRIRYSDICKSEKEASFWMTRVFKDYF